MSAVSGHNGSKGPPARRGLAAAALFGAILCFSGNYVLGGVAAAVTPLMSLMFIKWGAAALPMLLLAQVVERPDWRQLLSHWKRIVVLSSLGIAGYSFMLYHALGITTPVKAALINAFNPAMILAVSAIVLGERLTGRKLVGVLMGLAGVLYVLSRGDITTLFAAKFNTGDLWMLGAISCWTGYTVIIGKNGSLPPLANSALQMIFFTLVMTPVMLVEGMKLPSTTAGAWAMVYIAVFPAAVAYALWNIGARTIEPGQAGQFLNLMVPITAALSALSGGTVTRIDMIGGVLILGGVYLTSSNRAKQADAVILNNLNLVDNQV